MKSKSGELKKEDFVNPTERTNWKSAMHDRQNTADDWRSFIMLTMKLVPVSAYTDFKKS